MARKSRMSVLKRQRELKKREKAAAKRAKRHGVREDGFSEPLPTVGRRLIDDDSDDMVPIDDAPRPAPARAEKGATD